MTVLSLHLPLLQGWRLHLRSPTSSGRVVDTRTVDPRERGVRVAYMHSNLLRLFKRWCCCRIKLRTGTQHRRATISIRTCIPIANSIGASVGATNIVDELFDGANWHSTVDYCGRRRRIGITVGDFVGGGATCCWRDFDCACKRGHGCCWNGCCWH